MGSVQVLSTPGLACSPTRVTHPEFEGLERWDGHQSGDLEDYHPCRGPRPWGPAGRVPTPLSQTPEQQTAVDALKEHSAAMGRELLDMFLCSLEPGLGDFRSSLQSSLTGRAQASWCPFPTLGAF